MHNVLQSELKRYTSKSVFKFMDTSPFLEMSCEFVHVLIYHNY